MDQKDSVSKSWFCVFNNPEEHGYTGTPEEILSKLKEEWCGSSLTRTGAWIYCISEAGLHHVHLVLEDKKSMRFSAIKKAYAEGMHIEATKGSKKDVLAYINKEGEFAEKGEQVIAKLSSGEINGCSSSGQKSNRKMDILLEAGEMITAGMKPAEIFNQSIQFQIFRKEILNFFWQKKKDDLPPFRKITVYWHIGDSGSGKTHTFIELCEQYGNDNVYMLNDYDNNATGAFDVYNGETILFMDEFKGNISYAKLLNILEGYKMQIHCRYANSYAFWDEIHITSIYPPEEIFKQLVSISNQNTDSFRQFMRRLTSIIYHYKEGSEFKTYEQKGSDYVNYCELLKKIKNQDSDEGFHNVTDQDKPPFNPPSDKTA